MIGALIIEARLQADRLSGPERSDYLQCVRETEKLHRNPNGHKVQDGRFYRIQGLAAWHAKGEYTEAPAKLLDAAHWYAVSVKEVVA